MARERTRKRKGKGERRRSDAAPFGNLPFAPLRNPWPPLEIATPELIERIHQASVHVLENIGLRFLHEEAISLWAQAGAKVDQARQHVWLDRDLVMSLVAQAPDRFVHRARNPQHSRTIGGNHINFFPNAGMVNVRSLKRGRRPGTAAVDYQTILKLIQSCPQMHFAGADAIAMHDVPVSERHLRQNLMTYQLSDKAIMTTSHGSIIVNDGLAMARIVFGDDLTSDGPVTGGVVNVNSPLTYDDRMLAGLLSLAQAGQYTVITPFILAGAMSPVSIPAAVAQQNAEALAGIALTQLVRPGAPVVYGGFTTNVDMQSGSPSFGTPEGAWALLLGGQLARHYGLPYRGSGSLNNANVPDAQAAYESLWTLWPAVQAHANIIVHAVGWLEAGLTVSLEKWLIDAENLAMMQTFLAGPRWDLDAFALESIAEVGPGGHHFGTAHTLAYFADAFHQSSLAGRQNFQTWQAAGSEDIVQRASRRLEVILANFVSPLLDQATEVALAEYATERALALANVNLYE